MLGYFLLATLPIRIHAINVQANAPSRQFTFISIKIVLYFCLSNNVFPLKIFCIFYIFFLNIKQQALFPPGTYSVHITYATRKIASQFAVSVFVQQIKPLRTLHISKKNMQKYRPFSFIQTFTNRGLTLKNNTRTSVKVKGMYVCRG